MSTGKSELCNNIVGSRLDALRAALTMNWGELADHLRISRSMLDFMRKGERNPSPQMLRSLMDAERAAGIGPPTSAPPAPPHEPAIQRSPSRGAAEPAQNDPFPMLGKLEQEISNHWKETQAHFQSLEKDRADLSNHRKLTEEKFQSLEAKLDRLLALMEGKGKK